MIRVPHKFPIGISAYDERAGWTDSMNRAAKYVEVDYFFEHNALAMASADTQTPKANGTP